LFKVAQETGLESQLAQGLARTPIAAIGPIVEESLHLHGIACTIRPKSNFHLKPLVRAIIDWRTASTSRNTETGLV